jgi:hypothetical protein
MSEEPLEEIEKGEEEISLPDAIQKTKKPRTAKQIEAFEKVRKIRDEKRAERKEIKVKAETEYKQQKEEKIVKKALAIKKKQILADKVLDEVSEDDDIPIEVVKKIMKKYPNKSAPAKQERVAQPVYTPTLTFI